MDVERCEWVDEDRPRGTEPGLALALPLPLVKGLKLPKGGD